jgi:predicted O-linked N-acetylglucosamine transferase (SPINDLY family)
MTNEHSHSVSEINPFTHLRTLFNEHRYQECILLARKIVVLQPDSPLGWLILAQSYVAQQQLPAAIQALRHLCTLQPDQAWVWHFLGTLLNRTGQIQEAISCLQHALALTPDDAELHNALGLIFMHTSQLFTATHHFQQALTIDPTLEAAWNNLATAQRDLQLFQESEQSFRHVLTIYEATTTRYSNWLFSSAYLSHITPEMYKQRAENWEWVTLTSTQRQQANTKTDHHARQPQRRYRLGIISAEFGLHPVAYFLLSWLQHLNRHQWQLYLYPTQRYHDHYHDQFQTLADTWLPIDDMDDDQACHVIRNHQLDIILDTSGHTAQNRLGIIARRVAPVQAHYIGYFATTGLSQMDYFIADSVLVPPEHETHFSEKIWRLPRSRYAYHPPQQVPMPTWHPDPQGRLWLGSFNNLTKVTPETLQLWAKLLQALPHAQLLLKDRKTQDSTRKQQVLNTLNEYGINKERVEFLGHVSSWVEHMTLYNRLDIALDTIPFNSATTGFEALWMGVPMITLAGDRFAGRQAASLLTGLGHHDWIANNPNDYINKIIHLAHAVDDRMQWRYQQRHTMQNGELCDGKGLARDLEHAFTTMLQQAETK